MFRELEDQISGIADSGPDKEKHYLFACIDDNLFTFPISHQENKNHSDHWFFGSESGEH